LARHTGQDPERIARDSDRNFFMDAAQAREYGIIDEILHAGETAAAPGETK
jgi:ATP-dependent Clp protease protease subunit